MRYTTEQVKELFMNNVYFQTGREWVAAQSQEYDTFYIKRGSQGQYVLGQRVETSIFGSDKSNVYGPSEETLTEFFSQEFSDGDILVRVDDSTESKDSVLRYDGEQWIPTNGTPWL